MINQNTAITHECRECSQPNELPFLFCGNCNTPRFRVGKYLVLFHIILISLVFFGVYFVENHENMRYYAEDYLIWSWPIYLLYGYLALTLAVRLAAGKWGLAIRHVIWYILCILLFLAYYEISHRSQEISGVSTSLITGMIAEGPNIAADYPLLFFPILCGIAIVTLVPCYMRWGKRYGWVNAYRIVLVSLIVIGLAPVLVFLSAIMILASGVFPGLHEHLIPLENSWIDYQPPLFIFVSRICMIFVMEIVIFSALKGHGRTHGMSVGLESHDTGKPGALANSLALFSVALRRLILTLENMLICLIEIIRQLAIQIVAVFIGFTREFMIPILMLILTGVMLHSSTLQTRLYIDHSDYTALLKILVNIVVLLLAMVIFMGCKTPFRFVRISRFYFELVTWMLPNLIVCSILISLFLFGSAYMADRLYGHEESHFPFRVGPITIVLMGSLIFLVIYLLIAKRSLFRVLKEEPIQSPKKGCEDIVTSWGNMPKGVDSQASGPVNDRTDSPGAKRSTLKRVTGYMARLVTTKKEEIAVGFSSTMAGRPAIVARLLNARDRHEVKSQELEALRNNRAKFSGETYSRMLKQGEREVEILLYQRDEIQAELNVLWAKKQQEKSSHLDNISDIDDRITEVKSMIEVGALGESEARVELKTLRAERERVQVHIDSCDEVLFFVDPECTQSHDD